MKKFPLLEQVPPELKDVLFDFWWDLEKLLALDLPETKVSVDDVRWHLELPFWQHEGKPFQVTPQQVQQNPDRYAEQYERTMQADLMHPIIVRQDGTRIIIIDGVHRLLKATLIGQTELRAKVFRSEFIPQILVSDEPVS